MNIGGLHSAKWFACQQTHIQQGVKSGKAHHQ